MLLRLVIVLLSALVIVAPASGTTFTVAPLKLLTGPSPFAPGCEGSQSGTLYVNAEVEPWVDVNPANPNNIIAVWQQDRWSNGGARGLVAGVSHDGGATWSRTWAHFSICSGGTAVNGGNYERTSDPWVSFSPNGNAFQIAISFNDANFTNAVLVSKSTNGGDTWSEPTVLIVDTSTFRFNDKESITADPTNSNLVYAVWDRSRFPSENADFNALHSYAFRGDILFSRTTNGGTSWEPARTLFGPRSNMFTIGNQIAVMPDGTLIDVFNLIRGAGVMLPQFFQAIIMSMDHGQTWSDPMIVARELAVSVRDPDTGAPVRTGAGLPDIAVDPTSGILYLVWEDARFSGFAHNDVAFSMSTNGGFTWSTPVKINKTTNNAAAFTPSVHVTPDGTVAVTYYDFRNNTPAAGLPTDYWIIHCHTGCSNPANWAESHVAGPFDMETAPIARGYFVGDYEGLASRGNTFVPVFVLANSGNTSNRTDVFETTAGP